jgi:hypothetical protein
MTPSRVQLRRTRGWRKPPDTVSVSRPTRWGNYVSVPAAGTPEAHALAVEEYRQAVMAPGRADFRREVRDKLRGKNLACWCPAGWPCHADVLLEIANGEEAD